MTTTTEKTEGPGSRALFSFQGPLPDGSLGILQCRSLTRGEINRFLELIETNQVYEAETIALQAVIVPSGYTDGAENLTEAEVRQVAHQILALSHRDVQENFLDLLDKERVTAETDLNCQIDQLICRAFPGMTPEDVDQLTYRQILRYATVAEKVTGLTLQQQKKNPFKPRPGSLLDPNSQPVGPPPTMVGPQQKAPLIINTAQDNVELMG